MTGAALVRALALAADGLPCFPCRANKKPACPRGFHAATIEPDQLHHLWRRYPGQLIGVATGEVSGIDVLDIDAPRHPEAAAWFEENRDRLPPTRTHCTPSGGLHLIFRHAGDMRGWTARPVIGIDGRATGNYAVWWPAAGLSVDTPRSLAPWPDWLRQAVARPRPAPRAATSGLAAVGDRWLAALIRKVADAHEGSRNNILFWAGCRLRDAARAGKIGESFGAAALAVAATRAGLPSDEVERTIASALRAR
jgi:hypothetical protein